MAEVTLFSGQVDGFAYNSSIGVYFEAINPAPFVLELDKTYKVSWDGTEHELTPFVFNNGTDDMVAVGDRLLIGEESTGENFAIAYNPTTDYMNYFAMTTETSHTISVIVIEEDVEPEPEPEEVGIILKDRDGYDQHYYGVKGIKIDATDGSQMYFSAGYPEEGTAVADFSSGDMVAKPDTGKLWTQLTIPKPENLLPENVRNGIDVAGVVGEFIGDTEEVTADLSMAEGNQVISPSADGKVLSKVTVTKPDTLIPENIVEGVNIGGVVGSYVVPDIPETEEKTVELDFSDGDMAVEPSEGKVMSLVNIPKPDTLLAGNIAEGVMIAGIVGTHSGGGGGESSGHLGEYTVIVFDYDGSIIAGGTFDSGSVFKLPDAPVHERLVFEGWSSPVEITNNSITVDDQDIYIGATYHTASGATEVDIELTKASGLTMTFQSGKLNGYTSIDWGDGTVEKTLTHTYADYGEYTIKIYGLTSVSNGSSNAGIVSNTLRVIKGIFFASGVTSIGSYALYGNKHLKVATIPSTVTTIYTYCFYGCSSLLSFAYPLGAISIWSYVFYQCYSMRYFSIHNGVTHIQTYSFQHCRSLDGISIPETVTTIQNYAFANCPFKKIRLPSALSSLGTYVFQNCPELKRVVLPQSITAIGAFAFNNCYSLTELICQGSITSIGNTAFAGLSAVEVIDLSACQNVPTVSGTFLSGHGLQFRFLVPSNLYDTWIAATTWSNYANYIYAV